MKWALICHDAVYDPARRDNEACSFLCRERLHHTALYREHREALARANLEGALARLRQA
jgi:predicted metal-dependent HD superfamily phosphohydrolase